MVSALQQFQITIDTVAPMQLQGQLGERIQEWSRVISNSIPYQIEPLTNVTYPLGSCEAIRVGSTPTTRTTTETPLLARIPALQRGFSAGRGVFSLPFCWEAPFAAPTPLFDFNAQGAPMRDHGTRP